MRGRSARRHTSRARSVPAPRPAPSRRDAHQSLMPRMAAAGGSRASAALAASLMPPALPRLPVGTCALTHARTEFVRDLSRPRRASRPGRPAAWQSRPRATKAWLRVPRSSWGRRLLCSLGVRHPRDGGSGRCAGLLEARIPQGRGEAHRRPDALVLGIAAKLLVAERAVRPAKQVDATMAIVGLDALPARSRICRCVGTLAAAHLPYFAQ